MLEEYLYKYHQMTRRNMGGTSIRILSKWQGVILEEYMSEYSRNDKEIFWRNISPNIIKMTKRNIGGMYVRILSIQQEFFLEEYLSKYHQNDKEKYWRNVWQESNWYERILCKINGIKNLQRWCEKYWKNIYSNIAEITRRNIGSGGINDTKNIGGTLE